MFIWAIGGGRGDGSYLIIAMKLIKVKVYGRGHDWVTLTILFVFIAKLYGSWKMIYIAHIVNTKVNKPNLYSCNNWCVKIKAVHRDIW